MSIAAATRRVRETRGNYYLTKGGDTADHRAAKKARRGLDHAIIQEQLEETDPPAEPEMLWVVEEFFCDGDKWWLDDFWVTFVSEDFEAANQRCIESDAVDSLTTDGRLAPKSRLTYRSRHDYDVEFFLDRRHYVQV